MDAVLIKMLPEADRAVGFPVIFWRREKEEKINIVIPGSLQFNPLL